MVSENFGLKAVLVDYYFYRTRQFGSSVESRLDACFYSKKMLWEYGGNIGSTGR